MKTALFALLLVLAMFAVVDAITEPEKPVAHDYCPDIPGTQELIDGAVICDVPMAEDAG